MKEEEKRKERKSIFEMVKEILTGRGSKELELTELPLPEESVVETLIGKASGNEGRGESGDPAKDFRNEEKPEVKKGCPYATKRAIVESLAAIRKFAEENELASTVVRALLTLLAEMALDALKGKVGIKALETLLKAFNYESARKEAYKEGEKAGKNARIKEELFPESPKDLPDMNGSIRRPARDASIFDIARNDG